MGIDAQMCFILKWPLKRNEVRQLALDAHEAFGGNLMDVCRDNYSRERWEREEKGVTLDEILKTGRRAHHCITRTNEFTQDGDSIFPQEGEHLYEVHLWCRYYDDGYERGPLAQIMALVEWLEWRLPDDARIFYGGDSSGAVAREMDEEYRQELWDHFCEHGNKPYYGTPTRLHARLGLEEEKDIPTCQLCKKPYVRYGGREGGPFASFLCDGCGHGIQTNNYGTTWTPHPRLMNDRSGGGKLELKELQTFKAKVRRAALERELGRNNESFLKTVQDLLAEDEH